MPSRHTAGLLNCFFSIPTHNHQSKLSLGCPRMRAIQIGIAGPFQCKCSGKANFQSMQHTLSWTLIRHASSVTRIEFAKGSTLEKYTAMQKSCTQIRATQHPDQFLCTSMLDEIHRLTFQTPVSLT